MKGKVEQPRGEILYYECMNTTTEKGKEKEATERADTDTLPTLQKESEK